MFLDVVIIYLFREFTHAIKFVRSRSWPDSKAFVMSAVSEGSLAKIYYQYTLDGQNYADEHVKPFFMVGLAKEYAHNLQRGDELRVRVKPGEPRISVLEEPGPRYHGRP